MEPLRLTFAGDPARMDARALTETAQAAVRLVQALQPGKRTTLTVADVHFADHSITVNAPAEVTDLIERGLSQLAQEATRPRGWSDQALSAASRVLRGASRRGVKEMRVGRVGVDKQLKSHVKAARTGEVQSLGSVRGRLFRYSSRGGYEAAIETPQGVVRLTLGREHATTVKALLDKEAVAWGVLTRQTRDNSPTLLHVTGICAPKNRKSHA